MAQKNDKAEKNRLYEIVDHTIKHGLSTENLNQIVQIASKQEPMGSLFDLPETHEYIIKRYINACMSTDSSIRENSALALQRWIEASSPTPNIQKLTQYIIDVSNYKKGGNRKSETDAFASGRVLVVRSLSSLLKNNTTIFESISQILVEFKHLEQEALEACHLISFDKVLKLKFHSLSPKNESSRFLYKLLLQTKDPNAEGIKKNDITEIIEIECQNYPKNSTVLYNMGKYLHLFTDSPLQFFRQYANKFLDNDSQSEADIHEIYGILTCLKGFLDNNTITMENYQSHWDKKIISVWLEQFRVLNKKMKELAKSMSIKFEQSSELAYRILLDLHEEGIYLDNISSNHPLAQLYQWVEIDKYWSYLHQLCLDSEKQLEEMEPSQANPQQHKGEGLQQDQQNQQEQESEPPTFYNELEYFIKLRFKEMPTSSICSTITLLLNKYRKDQKEKQQLFLCINLFNMICKTEKKSKKNSKKFNKRMLLVLNDLKIEELKGLGPQQITGIKKSILWIKKSTLKIRKDQQYEAHVGEIDFLNFYGCLIYFCLIYPDQTETCRELELVYEGLMSFYAKRQIEATGQPKKKVKRQKDTNNDKQEEGKPIHVLTDIFISLMTKPPVFLRKAIHNLFENIIPYLNEADIGNMLTVIMTPDADFIQQI